MSVKNVSISGEIFDAEKNPIKGIPVFAHALTDLFKTTHVAQTTTEEQGKYKVHLPIGLNVPIVLTSNPSCLKKFILVHEEHPEVNIPSPTPRHKKQRLNPERVTHKKKSSSFEKLAKSSMGPYWAEKVIKKEMPDITTESIQQEYGSKIPIPLTIERFRSFLNNSLFFSPPRKHPQQKLVYQVPSMDQSPEVRITLQHHLTTIALRYPQENWVEANQNEPHFHRFLYLANSAALLEGLTTKLLSWAHTLPTLYAQSFLMAISEKNPLRILLGPLFNDAYLIDRHLGLLDDSPLLDLLLSMGISRETIDQKLINGLRLNPLVHRKEIPARTLPLKGSLRREQAFRLSSQTKIISEKVISVNDDPERNHDLSQQMKLIRDLVITPVLEEFFDKYRNDLLSKSFFPEVEKLILTHEYLKNQAKNADALEGKPLESPGEKYKECIYFSLKEWCEEALLLTIFYPFALKRSLIYLTDLRFASLRPENRALTPENIFDPYGMTMMENATKQLTRAQLILKSKRPHLIKVHHLYPKIIEQLSSNRDELMKAGIDIDKLTI